MTIGSAWPGRSIVTVQPPGAAPSPLTPPIDAAVYEHVGVESSAWQRSVLKLGGVFGVGGGLRSPAVPVGGAGTGSPQPAGTFGFSPPVHHGSRLSRPYQLMISSVKPKPRIGQPP